METKDEISIDYEYVYEKVITDFHALYERNMMGGNMGIHFPEHDPHFQLDPNF